ncbi:carboxylating nicotinate-nucleotide diphosphorylase [Clostridium tagluense]|uniref:carboxylating nicotinate-nucleotide diphosphorylase n=1 Tax=Clostridium tagluense TaxID=360422 RepID=UPI001CF1F979|nr:carboxylating nicotinate-nucleotide diphosphorylase [Clostridium tagluense]MCB2311552.1 carboxylating nicotinate-nucleotide diphosphorylase [Clostridium tagluense]MCB2316276.1 carboxylating nicotinate-nucleotide diphosphorylase [Clostridium tagluense]MCB2321130.1 carboxylating nicotinate-nucleotide diphosphorylase [Clostridium tagluense]MCB2326145.1 carboxylating nicotinate-nucleotide diphosphorylase [Clostridium tagluense]MCB2330868.1 carboxylating nicotinate-nucleotide diphosphorylase [Cl
MNWLIIDDILIEAIKEDVPQNDITTEFIISDECNCSIDLIAKENGVIAGLPVFERVFKILGEVNIEFFKKDGDEVCEGQCIAQLSGKTKHILTGERTALNFLGRMSGIATLTKTYVDKLRGIGVKILDTRKTTPNMRIFEKYAVKMGGGCNHRYNLSDSVLIKENHISAAGGIKAAVSIIRQNVSFVKKIEVEVETLQQINEALEVGADIIMLDNMDSLTMKKAVEIINKKAIIEASGNVTLDNILEVASCGVDYISVGALTHSFRVLDLSMKNLVNS